MSLIDIIGGAALLTLGRRLFWLFVAASGFFAGLEVATRTLHLQPAWVTYAIALLVGVVGALLAYFVQKVAIGAAGFFAGAYLASRLASQLVAQGKSQEWLVLLIGGIIGILLVYMLFEGALVILSSLAGAVLVVDGLKLAGLVGFIAGALLFVIGIVFQTRLGGRKRSLAEANG